MPYRNDPAVFRTPYDPAFEVSALADDSATFGRNADKLWYMRHKAQVQQAVRQTAQTQARQKESPMPKTVEQLQAELATLQAETARLRADHAHFQRYGEYPVRPEERQRLLSSSPLGRAVLQHDAAEQAATFAKGSKYSRDQLAKLTPKDFADPTRLEYPILDQEDLDAAADAMLEAAKVPMLFDKEKDDRMRTQIRAIAQRRGLRLPDHWRTTGLDERGHPVVPPDKVRQALEASSLGRAVLRQAPKG